jgi:hypothetical protein
MAFKYQKVVPWGRSFSEYCRMFHLTDEDLQRSILGCADGPASFNAEMSRQGHRVISCDPLYHLTSDQIKQRIDVTYDEVIRQARQNEEKFVWDRITSPDELGHLRLEAMSDFLDDYERGKRDGRYIPAELPDLPFGASSFDIALCSHFLFFYSDCLSLAFHQQAVDELCRVAHQVRIFPMLTYNAEPSPLVAPIAEHARKASRIVSLDKVSYEFQRGGNVMMKILNGGSV